MHYGDELMHLGMITTDASSGQDEENMRQDYDSRLYILKAVEGENLS